MTEDFGKLAELYGIEPSYVSEDGTERIIPDTVKKALLEAMGVAGAASGDASGVPETEAQPSARARCFIPEWLAEARSWGVTVQLYGVRSRRNSGIGDFEDLARIAEMFGPLGADFVGVNPLHALFGAEPERASPYSPSSRSFINPLYISLDPHFTGEEPAAWHDLAQALRETRFVDYGAVTALKREVLKGAFCRFKGDPAFDAFCEARGEELHRFAVFETLSQHLSARGYGGGWHGWSAAWRKPASRQVQQFAADRAEQIQFQKWLQWIAASELSSVQLRACACGMRIGVYLDLAVGVSPDGAAVWSEQNSFAAAARIGAPPDLFNHAGQDWGLAPLNPAVLKKKQLEPFAREVKTAMSEAGAIRLDHAMGLTRLYWVPAASDARGGGYVRYPLEALLNMLAAESNAGRCIVIGEDLGTVPEGFRDTMLSRGILSYRVLYFERDAAGAFVPPPLYPRLALACVATHDLPPLRGWWSGTDIDVRLACGRFETADDAEGARRQRRREKAALLNALRDNGICADADPDTNLPDSIFTGAHRYLARSSSCLLAVQLEDLAGSYEMVNLPGTDRQHPNWRRKLPHLLEEVLSGAAAQHVIEAVQSERPRLP